MFQIYALVHLHFPKSAGPNHEHSSTVINTCVKEGSSYRLNILSGLIRAGPAPMQPLKASSDGAETAATVPETYRCSRKRKSS